MTATIKVIDVQGSSNHNRLNDHGRVGFLVNHTSIHKPHPVLLWLHESSFVKKCSEIFIQPYHPIDLMYGQRDLLEKQASN